MEFLFNFLFLLPAKVVLVAACAAGVVLFGVRAARLLRLGITSHGHPSQSMWVVRGGRAGILAISCVAFGGGILFEATWALLFGVVFMGEELLETGTYILALRAAEKRAARGKEGRPP